MAALVRLMVIGFIVLSVIYVCLSLYSRAVRKGKLRAEWNEGPQEQPLDTFLEEGLAEYDKSLRRKLILSVYVIPVILVSVVVYLTNFALRGFHMFGLIRWTFLITVWVIIAAFFHYTLPQVDIVRVTDTYEKRIDPGENRWFWAQADVGTDGTVANRDVFFIQTRMVDGDVMVYRNEDTGWSWPPYFKFDTSNLQAEASDLSSSEAAPRYVAIKHYGWRNEFFTIFPNAISVRAVDGPDVSKGIPWLNIIILTLFAAVTYGIWVRWRRFRIARIDPTMEAIEDDLAEASGAVTGWLGSWRKKS